MPATIGVLDGLLRAGLSEHELGRFTADARKVVAKVVEAAAARVRNPGGLHPVLHVVTAETANRVRRYMRGVLAPMLMRADAMMFATTQTEHAAAIARYILAERLDRITMRQLMRYGPLALRAPEERPARESVMEGLCLFGWLRPVLRDAQPTIAWIVNPDVHSLYAERAEAERVRRAFDRMRPEQLVIATAKLEDATVTLKNSEKKLDEATSTLGRMETRLDDMDKRFIVIEQGFRKLLGIKQEEE